MTVGLGVGPRDLAGLAVARVDLVDLERSDRSAARLGRLRRLTDVAMVESFLRCVRASGPHRGGIIGTSKNESLSPPE